MFTKLETIILGKFGSDSKNWAGGTQIVKEVYFLGRRLKFQWKCTQGWGRFGGGWQWELGFQIGGSTIIINLLFCSLRIDKKKKQ